MGMVSAGTHGWHRNLCGVEHPFLPGKRWDGMSKSPRRKRQEQEGTWLTPSMELPGCVRHPAQSLLIFRLSVSIPLCQKISEQVLVPVLQAGLTDLFPSSQAYSLTLENTSTTSKWEQLTNEQWNNLARNPGSSFSLSSCWDREEERKKLQLIRALEISPCPWPCQGFCLALATSLPCPHV